jgi:hypothetical protein
MSNPSRNLHLVAQAPPRVAPASNHLRDVLAQWCSLVPARADDDQKVFDAAGPVLTNIGCMRSTSTGSEASSHVVFPSVPPRLPESLCFASTAHASLRGHARLFCQQVTSKPLATLYDTGFSGEILISEKFDCSFALPMELIDQPVILADGSTLNCLGIVRNVQFAPTNAYCETVDLLVFPLRSYDILVGMAWLRAHHTHIDCHALSLKFWPFNC